MDQIAGSNVQHLPRYNCRNQEPGIKKEVEIKAQMKNDKQND